MFEVKDIADGVGTSDFMFVLNEANAIVGISDFILVVVDKKFIGDVEDTSCLPVNEPGIII
tara:strand:+ start:516 stop:698 length:183 start_codon:yes stop_codon:yes gene_type:complete